MLKGFDIKKQWKYIVGSLLVVTAGVGSSYLVWSKVINKASVAAPGIAVTSTGAGVLDPKIKYDNATGTLKSGGIGNEGTHHIERTGGPSKNVYLTSSVIDLESFVDKEVEVWGETLASKKAGWLMDVAKVKIAE